MYNTVLNQTVNCVDLGKFSRAELECPISKPMRRLTEKLKSIRSSKDQYLLFITNTAIVNWESTPADVTWYSGGNSGRISLTIGLG